jgi:hypothetical protein
MHFRTLTVIFCSVALLLETGLADEPKPEVKHKVDQLVKQLGDADSDKQAAAVAALLKMGPDVLDLLPSGDANLTPAQQNQLRSVRTTLRDARAQKDLAPRTVALKSANLPLSQALKELARQTGLVVEDQRRQKTDPQIAVTWDNATFWEALDEIALKADLRVSLYDREGKVALVDGPHRALPVSHQGIFRTIVKRLTAERDLENETHFWLIQLEIAWEPRFQPLFVETQPENLVVQDGKGAELRNLPGGSGRAAVVRPLAVDTLLRVEAPRRRTDKIALIKGSLAVVSPSKMLTFTFDDLDKIDRANSKQTRSQTKEGVKVNLRELKAESGRWTIGFLLEYPPEGPDFESFESWLVNNQIFLEKKDGKARVPVNGTSEFDEQGGRRAALTYRFVEDNDLVLGKLSDWKLVYRTPGTMVRIPVKFEFKDAPVP